MSRSRRDGFTLVELLVVISIIGMLMALLLPAVGAATENARSLRCKNRLKQLAMATASYESRFERFPGYVNAVEVPGESEPRPLSWVVEIMADLERTDLLDLWKSSDVSTRDLVGNYSGTGYSPVAAPLLDFLTCPSDPPLGELPHVSYVANAGFAEADLAGCGIMHTRYPLRLANGSKIAHTESSLDKLAAGDGASTTILISENINAYAWPDPPFRKTDIQSHKKAGTATNVFVWHNEANPPEGSTIRINGGNYPASINPWSDRSMTPTAIAQLARPSSEHNGGVNAAFADGHVVFLKDDIDYQVYARLMSPDGKKCEKEFYKASGGKASNIDHRIPVSDVELR